MNAPANAPVAACRSFEDLAVQGFGTVGLGVMPFLIQGFANANGMRVTRSSDRQAQTRTYQLQGTESEAACFCITVRSTGSDTAKDAIVDKAAQIGMSSRVYTDSEIQVLAFAGRIRNWRELGGRPGAINLQVRLGPSGTFETFRTLVLKACGVELARTIAFSHGAYAALLAALAADEMSVGFAPEALVTTNVKALRLRGGVRHRAERQRVQHHDRGLSTVTTPVYLRALSARRLFAAAGEFHQGRRSRRCRTGSAAARHRRRGGSGGSAQRDRPAD